MKKDEALILDRMARLEGVEEVLAPLFNAYLGMRMDESAYDKFGEDLAIWLGK